MDKISILDKTFVVDIPELRIQERIAEMAKKISADLKDQRPMFICVLNGSFLFAADLFKRMSIECEIAFVRVSSYEGTHSTGVIKNLMGFPDDLKDRTVVILEDIVDSGDTAVHLLEGLKKRSPGKVFFASLLLKPQALKHDVTIDYVGFEVPNDFLVGYGLDYDGLGRNLRDIYKLSV